MDQMADPTVVLSQEIVKLCPMRMLVGRVAYCCNANNLHC